jgi:hypothetical protein
MVSIFSCVFWPSELEISAEQILPGSEGRWRGEEGEMAQTMYAHMNSEVQYKTTF